MKDLTDSQLVSLVTARNAVSDQAFDELRSRHQKYVYQVAYRMSGCHDDAWDIMQESFIRVWMGIASFRNNAKFSTWLYRIATNVFMDRVRHKKARPTVSLTDYPEPLYEDEAHSPHNTAELNERRYRLYKLLESLPETQRESVALVHLEDMTEQQAADVIGVGKRAVEGRIHRAFARLRRRSSTIDEDEQVG